MLLISQFSETENRDWRPVLRVAENFHDRYSGIGIAVLTMQIGPESFTPQRRQPLQ